MIMLKETSKAYGTKNILNKINLNINNGDLVLLIGENGSGKSTLLKLIAGLVRANKGSVINKEELNAYLPEKFTLPKNMMVKQYVSFLEESFQIDLSYYVIFLMIPDKKIRELSKGNLQKLGLIYLIASKLDTIILDEPTEGMDDEVKKKYLEIIKDLNKKGKTIIISTHNPKDYQKLNPRKINVNGGEIYED